jgi:hypothetical protein
MRDAVIERRAADVALYLMRRVVAEVVPKPQRDSGSISPDTPQRR